MNAIRVYKKMSVTTADPLQLVVMLYDGFLRHGRAALEAMKKKRPAETGDQIGRALPILHELQASLNHRAAPDLCANLDALYEFVNNSIMQAHLKSDADALEQALCIMAELREGWLGAHATIAEGSGTP